MTIHTAISPALDAFGKAVKAERLERKWSLAKLADTALGNPDRKGYCSQVEKGQRNLSEGTIRSFARALDLPASVIDPLTGHLLPSKDDTTESDAAAAALLSEVEALRDKLKLSEALAVAIAYKYADGNPTDIEGALKGLEAALELAAKDQERGRLPSNYEDAAEAVIQRVNALNEAGEIDQAYADLQAEAARRAEAMAAQKAEDGRILELLITQAALANDADGYAQAQLQKVQLDSPGAEETFERLRVLQDERYEEGLRLGTPFALAAAAGLARACMSTAPNRKLYGLALNDLGTVLALQGTRTDGHSGKNLLSEAIETYRIAIRAYEEMNERNAWSSAMQNLGAALETLGRRTTGQAGFSLLGEAIETYRMALRVRTESKQPVSWARATQNLAGALQSQGTRTTGAASYALLAEAVETYRAALRVFTETEHPVDWARTMQNLAGAMKEQSSHADGNAQLSILSEAIGVFRAALRVRTEADYPLDWAITQESLAITEYCLAVHKDTDDSRTHNDAALEHVDNALRIYDPVEMSFYHSKASRIRIRILEHSLQIHVDTLPSSSS